MSDTPQGEPGEPGKPGTPPPDSTGGAGGAGGVGVPGRAGLPGRRGAAGRRGQDGADGDMGETGRRGQHGDTGRPGRDGSNSISLISNGVSRLWAVAAILFLGAVVLALGVTLTSQARDKRTIDGLNDRVVGLNDQIVGLNAKADVIQLDQAAEQTVEDCRDLYEEDIFFARIARDLEEGDLFKTVVEIPSDATEAERHAITEQAVADLNVEDEALQKASLAFRRYVASYWPPLDCPHPDSK